MAEPELDRVARHLARAGSGIRTGGGEIDDALLEHARTIVTAGAAQALRIEPAPATRPGITHRGGRRAVEILETANTSTAIDVADLRVELIAVRRHRATRADVQPDVTDRRLRRAAIR